MNQALEFENLGSEHGREAPILDHLEELRWRLVWALGLWAVGSGVVPPPDIGIHTARISSVSNPLYGPLLNMKTEAYSLG